MSTADPVVVARSLYRFFRAGEEETLALRGVSLPVAAGELVAVTGPSGSGKSTLLACLAGLDEPDGGIVTIVGRRISHRPEPERARMRGAAIGVLLPGGEPVGPPERRGERSPGRSGCGRGEAPRDGDGSRRVLAAVGSLDRRGTAPTAVRR